MITTDFRRLVSRLALLAITTAAALALSPAGASAQHEVEVTNEDTALLCESSTSYCALDVHSEIPVKIEYHLSTGMTLTLVTCHSEFGARIETGGGDGYLHSQALVAVGTPNPCALKPCEATTATTQDGDPWPIQLHESESGTHEFAMDVELCLEPRPFGGGDLICDLEIPFNETEMSHQYELEASDGITCSNPPPAGVNSVEVIGHWLTEEPAFEEEAFEVQHFNG